MTARRRTLVAPHAPDDEPGGSRRRSRRERAPGRARRLVWPVLVTVVFIGVLFVAVFPTQTFLGQQREAEALRRELDEIEVRNAELQEQVEALEDPARIELMAREDFGLVRPGEEAYTIVPPDDGESPVPDAWPFDRLGERLESE